MTKLFSKQEYARHLGFKYTNRANIAYHLRKGNLKLVNLPVYADYEGEKIKIRDEDLIVID